MSEWVQPHNRPFYWIEPVLEKKPKVVISIGARGAGKTLAWKLQAIYDLLNDGVETIYIRRFVREVKNAKKEILKDIIEGDERLKSQKIEIHGDKIYVNNRVCVHIVSLSQALKMKSVVYSKVRNVVFDEFLTLDRTLDAFGYDEVTVFSEYLDTVYRLRDDVRIVLIANAISTTSKYFELFGFNKPINVKRRFQSPPHTKDVILEVWSSKNYVIKKSKSTLYKLLSPSRHTRYAIENEFAFEDDSNIILRKDIKGHLLPLFNIMTSDITLSVNNFKDKEVNYYITDRSIIDDLPVYTFDKEMVMSQALYVTSISSIAQMLTSAMTSGRLFFSSQKVKKSFLLNLKKIVKTYY
jgi:hypothetical protein